MYTNYQLNSALAYKMMLINPVLKAVIPKIQYKVNLNIIKYRLTSLSPVQKFSCSHTFLKPLLGYCIYSQYWPEVA